VVSAWVVVKFWGTVIVVGVADGTRTHREQNERFFLPASNCNSSTRIIGVFLKKFTYPGKDRIQNATATKMS